MFCGKHLSEDEFKAYNRMKPSYSTSESHVTLTAVPLSYLQDGISDRQKSWLACQSPATEQREDSEDALKYENIMKCRFNERENKHDSLML